YIGCALGEAILFSRLDNPLAWFQLSATYAGVVWLLFVYDMRLIHARIAESRNDADRVLYARAKADQLFNIRVLVPLLFFINLACALFIWLWPDLFIAKGGHVWLISAQLVSFIAYLTYIGRQFVKMAQLLLQSRKANCRRGAARLWSCQVLVFSSTIKVEDNESDPDQRLKKLLQKAQRKTRDVKTVCLLGFSQFLEQRLRILRRHYFIKRMLQRRPLGDERDR